MKYIVYADGGARGNPGPAGAGAIVRNETGDTVLTVSEFLGHTTNNVAEYTAVLRALQGIRDIAGSESAEVLVNMDSELVVKQMKGEYKIKHPNLKPLAEEVKKLLPHYAHVSFTHVRREQNKDADALANAAMDRGV
ncbi:ribonuclease HI family protein [Patescibacteria group bacterium]|nr:ribonuclease HI family protein [Patescibacteria group bacterium]